MSSAFLDLLSLACVLVAATCFVAADGAGSQLILLRGTGVKPVALGVAAMIFPIARFLRFVREGDLELHRIDHGLCRRCGYRLRGCTGRCPECGRPFRPHESVALRADADR